MTFRCVNSGEKTNSRNWHLGEVVSAVFQVGELNVLTKSVFLLHGSALPGTAGGKPTSLEFMCLAKGNAPSPPLQNSPSLGCKSKLKLNYLRLRKKDLITAVGACA